MHAGKNFSFTEAMEVPNAVAAYLGSFALVCVYLVISITFLRPLVMRLLPKPGEGPSKKQQTEGFWCAPESYAHAWPFNNVFATELSSKIWAFVST